MRNFFANSLKNEVFTPCDFRLVNVGFDFNDSTFGRTTNRLRKDYYIFHVDSGKIVVQTSKNDYVIVEKGEFFIYFPETHQHFWYEGDSKVRTTWINFMGSECDNLIKELQIKEGKVEVIQNSNAQEILRKILKENVQKKFGYEVMSKSLLFNLLVTLARDKATSKSLIDVKPIYENMMKIIDTINQNPRISNKNLADLLNMSTDHFIRVFKSLFKVTPHQYKLEVIMDTAKNYLLSSNLTVNQIAELLGYNNDELYFNASFKKFVGVSPTEFREKNSN